MASLSQISHIRQLRILETKLWLLCFATMAVVAWNRCATIHLSRIFTKVKSFVQPERLPPTTSSTNFHCLRVYYQIMVWMGTDDDMEVLDWGWKLDNNQMVPIMTDMKAAPDNLLKMIHCNCESCPPRCTCRRYGLPCHAGCGPCQTGHCDNQYNIQVLIDDHIESEND